MSMSTPNARFAITSRGFLTLSCCPTAQAMAQTLPLCKAECSREAFHRHSARRLILVSMPRPQTTQISELTLEKSFHLAVEYQCSPHALR